MDRIQEIAEQLSSVIGPLLVFDVCKRCQGQKVVYEDFSQEYDKRVKKKRWGGFTEEEAWELRCKICNGTGKINESYMGAEDLI